MPIKYFLAIFLLTVCFYLQAQSDFITVIDVKLWDFISKDVKIEKIASGYQFVEGPVWHGDGFLLFSDIPANTIFKLTPEGKSTVYITPSGNSNGLTFDKMGNLVACEHAGRRIVSYDKMGKLSVLIDKLEGKKPSSPNDIVFKKDGSFFFTDPPYGLKNGDQDSLKELKMNGVYYVKEGKTIVIDSTLARPNGIALSPDEKTLYVAQSQYGYLWKAYQINEKGSASRTLMQEPEITGNPDGIKVDVEGNIYCTGNGGVVIMDKKGKFLGSIKLPENPANLAFGDKDLQSLYITASKSIYRIRVKKKGHLAY